MSQYPPHPHISIHPPTPTTIPLLKRLNTLLLPIPYPQTFYAEILPSRTLTRLTRLAFYQPTTTPTTTPSSSSTTSSSPSSHSSTSTPPVCVGGIRCRLEDGGNVYVMTLCTLSPYRGLGVAGRLLDAVLGEGVKEVYAHVWEMNVEGIGWYERRGFEVGDVVAGYYRRLKPGGARVVKRRVGIGEWIGREKVVFDDEDGEEGGDVEKDKEEEEEARDVEKDKEEERR